MKNIFSILLCLLTINAFSLELQSKEVSTNHTDIHYYQTTPDKAKQDLIMLTGIGTTANFWPRDFILFLSEKYNLYILDYRGINTSQPLKNIDFTIKDLARDTNDFIKIKKLKNVSLLGWSMGGSVALQSVFDDKKLFKSLLLISPALPEENYKEPKKLQEKPNFRISEDIYNYVFTNNIYSYRPKQLKGEIKRFIDPTIDKLFPGSKIYATQKIALKNWMENKENVYNFKRITTPTTIFLAKNDVILDYNLNQDTINELKDKSTLNVIYFTNSGHAIDWEYPQKLANLINNLY